MRPGDEDAVADVLARYAACWDGRDVEGWLALFAEDCIFVRSGADPVEGKLALRATFAPMLHDLRASGRATCHEVTGVTVVPDGPAGATASAAVVFTGDAGEAGAAPVVVRGRYDVRLVRSPGGWLISEWRYTRLAG